MSARLRNLRETDSMEIKAALDAWWAGRSMSSLMPRPFFRHFQNTSFVLEGEDGIIAFLVGLISQTFPEEAYIHLVGVRPDRRREGVARRLYENFFREVEERGCKLVRCIASPVNRGSIDLHRALGFEIEGGNGEVEGVPVTKDYGGPGKDRVLFVKTLL